MPPLDRVCSDDLMGAGRMERLSREDENRLARAVERGQEVDKQAAGLEKRLGRPPTDAEVAAAVGVAGGAAGVREVREAADDARFTLLKCNLPLVFFAVSKIKANRNTIDHPDLVQYSALGLMRAIEYFRPGRKAKLATFALLCMQQEMWSAVNKAGSVTPPPPKFFKESKQVMAAFEALRTKLGREPTNDEVGLRVGKSAQRVAELRSVTTRFTNRLGEDDVQMWGLKSEGPDLRDCMREGALRDELSNVLDTLAPRERNVVRMHYGLDGLADEPMTYTEIGQAYGLSRERIRMIEDRALRKLRHPLRAVVLEPHLPRTKDQADDTQEPRV